MFILTNSIDGIRKKNFYIDTKPLIKKSDEIYYLFGELFNEDEIIQEINEGKFDSKKMLGEYILIRNIKNKKITIYNDILNIERYYYFFNKGCFIVSDNFWRLINEIEVDEKNIDIQALKEMIFLHKSLNEKTYVDGVNESSLSHNIEYDIKKETLSKIYKKRINYRPKAGLDYVKDIDQGISELVCYIKKKFGDDVYSAIGLSGGLDSRIIPIYLDKYQLDNYELFQIGEIKPNKITYSYDTYISQKIAQNHRKRLYVYDFKQGNMNYKLKIDAFYNPTRTSNAIKVIDDVPDWDILLTGGYGTMVGGHVIFPGVNDASSEELRDIILSILGRFKKPQSFIERIKKTLVSKNGKGKRIDRKSVPGILKKTEYYEIERKLDTYIADLRDIGYDNFDIVMNYHLGISNKYGSFESLSGRKTAYSIYYPYVFEKTLNWENDCLFGRKLLVKLYNEIKSDVNIPGQYRSQYDLIDSFVVRRIQNIKSYIQYLFRRTSLLYESWMQDESFNNILNEMIDNPNPLLLEHIDFNLIRYTHLNSLVIENLVKMNYILNIIFEKKYLEEFGSLFHPESSNLEPIN